MKIILFAMPSKVELIFIFLFLAMFWIPKVFYIFTLQNTIEAIHPQLRKMPAAHAWFLMIPFFGTIWHFFVIKFMAESIKAQHQIQDFSLYEENPAYHIGLTMCILNCMILIPIVNIAALICFIMYWQKINDYKYKIKNADYFKAFLVDA